MQIRVKTPTDGGEAEFLTKFYCDYKKYYIYLRKTNLNIGAHEHSSLHNCSFAAVRLHYINVGCGCARCAQVVQIALNAGGVKTTMMDFLNFDDYTPSESIPYMPISTFKAIQYNYPNGKIINIK